MLYTSDASSQVPAAAKPKIIDIVITPEVGRVSAETLETTALSFTKRLGLAGAVLQTAL